MTRIVAGAARGRRLAVPPGARPTSDRAREGVYSSLQSLLDLSGARVLDLCAGSGALGLEALSRGAAEVVLVERDPGAVRVLRDNAAAVGLPGAVVVHADALEHLRRADAAGADLVLLDPPWADPVDPLLAELPRHLADDAVVVVERAARGAAPTWPAGLVEERARRYGEAVVRYARAVPLASAP